MLAVDRAVASSRHFVCCILLRSHCIVHHGPFPRQPRRQFVHATSARSRKSQHALRNLDWAEVLLVRMTSKGNGAIVAALQAGVVTHFLLQLHTQRAGPSGARWRRAYHARRPRIVAQHGHNARTAFTIPVEHPPTPPPVSANPVSAN